MSSRVGHARIRALSSRIKEIAEEKGRDTRLLVSEKKHCDFRPAQRVKKREHCRLHSRRANKPNSVPSPEQTFFLPASEKG